MCVIWVDDGCRCMGGRRRVCHPASTCDHSRSGSHCPPSRYIFWRSIERYCWYQIHTGSPKRRRLILLDQSDLILAESFHPYFLYLCTEDTFLVVSLVLLVMAHCKWLIVTPCTVDADWWLAQLLSSFVGWYVVSFNIWWTAASLWLYLSHIISGLLLLSVGLQHFNSPACFVLSFSFYLV